MVICRNCEVNVGSQVVVNDKGKRISLCDECFGTSVILERPDGTKFAWYTPQVYQRPYHASNRPNLLALGTRGTGKSLMMRKDAIIRCMNYPGFKALILRRKIPDLQKSHLRFINAEMKQLGDEVGYYRESTHDVVFGNGSFIQFSHCETLKDVENYLSSEWDLIILDELPTFLLDMFLKISAAARSPDDAPYIALVRAGGNPLGPGAGWMKQWFIDKDVNLAEYPDYDPDDFEMQFSTLDQNRYVNKDQYIKRLKNQPAHIRKAWLEGEFVIEGAYFTDFQPTRRLNGDNVDWHVVEDLPRWRASDGFTYDIRHLDWISVYRAVDWGYFPDPAVCLWVAVLPNQWQIVFKELTWTRTLAKDVAREIKKASEGMHVVETMCDPTMFIKTGNAQYSIGEIFEQNGVPLTAAQNSRELYGYAIHEGLNTLIQTEQGPRPQVQIWKHCNPAGPSELIRTLPILEMDPSDSRKIANGPDHWACALAYFRMGNVMPVREQEAENELPRWMRPKAHTRAVVG